MTYRSRSGIDALSGLMKVRVAKFRIRVAEEFPRLVGGL
jgi:hypothetical protein